ncbi:MAG: queuosine precursor transporter [Betaproteobacteria bacterium]|nr:queuosine precursor transporter [Betaproteobacteria bacterium]
MPSFSNSLVGGARYLGLFTALNIAFQLISDVSAGKIISVLGVGVSVTVLYFPVTYIISDVLTEVYGYGRARTVLWYTMFASITAGVVYQLIVVIPPAPFFQDNDAYAKVFGTVPRILLGGWLAVFLGDISNNYVLARMKLWTNGKYLWTRTIGSTIVGQGINTVVFYVVALGGVLPTDVLVSAVMVGWLVKTCVEALMTPFTYAVVRFLKKAEGVDYFDRDTDFNPFLIFENRSRRQK